LDGGKFDPRGLVVTLSVILVLGFSYFSMQPRHGVTEIPDKQIIDRAEAIIEQWGTSNDKLTLTGDKSLMFAENDRAVIAFAKHARSWIALGAPVGAKDAILELMWDFVDAARREGAKPVFYEADKRFMPFAVDLGFSLFKMGEEAIINLKTFSL
jgi:phosphatidylglycerol lysyltransferase